MFIFFCLANDASFRLCKLKDSQFIDDNSVDIFILFLLAYSNNWDLNVNLNLDPSLGNLVSLAIVDDGCELERVLFFLDLHLFLRTALWF